MQQYFLSPIVTTTTTCTTTTLNITTSMIISSTLFNTTPTATTPVTSITATTTPTPLPPSTNNVNYAICDKASEMCWVLVGIGSVIVAILLIAAITCMIFTATVVKGMNALIQFLSNSATDNGERAIQPQQQQPQNQGIYTVYYGKFLRGPISRFS